MPSSSGAVCVASVRSFIQFSLRTLSLTLATAACAVADDCQSSYIRRIVSGCLKRIRPLPNKAVQALQTSGHSWLANAGDQIADAYIFRAQFCGEDARRAYDRYTAAFIRKSERILTGTHSGSWWGRMWPAAKSKAPLADWANLSLT
jgi:hypothetical protein